MHTIIIQRAITLASLPPKKKFKLWVEAALKNTKEPIEVTLRIVDKIEMTELNKTYRQKNYPTNVLSFPFHDEDIFHAQDAPQIKLLGDIAICAAVVEEEAFAQHKSVEAHYAHMTLHGMLHLLGFDHENKQDADIMEMEEIRLLTSFHFPNPYLSIEGEQNER